MGLRYRPGDGIRFAIFCFGITIYTLYIIFFNPTPDYIGSIGKEIALLISFIGSGIIGKVIYRLMIRNLGEERAESLDLKIERITTVVFVIAVLLVFR
ncbi:MAG: hypothetical protein K6B74_12185 [Ruminococcus sp.]|nr:hypothetical protein [Ruminococcus sp.]